MAGSHVQVQFTTVYDGLVRGGTLVAGAKPTATATSQQLTTTNAYVTFGSSTDLWGLTDLAPADINSSGFGVQFSASNGGASLEQANVDHVRITIYYTVPPQLSANVAGSITLTVGRKYCIAYRNSTTGHISDISGFSASSGALAARNQPLTGLTASTDSQVDRKLVLATSDGGDENTLYLVADIPNATTTLTDDVTEDTLLIRPIYLYTDDQGNTFGVVDNSPPPNMTLPFKHRGRVYGVAGQYLYFSKNLDEVTTPDGTIAGRYEECFPAGNSIDISEGAETIRAAMSDGEKIYIGTDRHIRVITGDGPASYSTPEILFNDIGVLSNEVWKSCYVEDKPVGFFWMSPDKKVIGSDFNAYKDVGSPIQDVLNTINTSYMANACAAYVGDGQYDLYVLAIPTGSNTDCDTLCIYDLRRHRWAGTWALADSITAMYYNRNASGVPQFLIATTTGKVYQMASTYSQDRTSDTPVSITSTGKTAFLSLGEPKARKTLNEIELLSGETGLTTTVTGASTHAEFASPVTVVSAAPLATSPLGEYKVYLAGKTSKDRYYQFTFVSTGAQSVILDGYSVEFSPVHYV